jgi:hypothetical protein
VSIQHAQQRIASLYDYGTDRWSTEASSYSRHYLEHLTEGRSHPDKGRAYRSLHPNIREVLKNRIEMELAR